MFSCTEKAAVYAGGSAAAPFGSAWLCLQEAAVKALPVVDGVLERGVRGCATPLAPAQGPVARNGSNSLAYVFINLS